MTQHLSTRTKDCPPWCAGLHDDDTPEDRYHESAQEMVSVLIARREKPKDSQGPVQRIEEVTELGVVAVRPDGSRETWVVLVEERQAIELSAESALRLHGALGRLFDRL